ncbi:Rab5 GDP/GTP exchange factor [Actinomortierella ambigua]|nr:Rab5 GDP/GTP exchange factor [Actinomortierella ambigua]
MEDNNAQNLPVYCANGCGFYGNHMNNNMCSKCFKEWNQKNGIAQPSTTQPTSAATPSTTTSPTTSAPSVLSEKPAAKSSPVVSQPAVIEAPKLAPPVSTPSPAPATPTLVSPSSTLAKPAETSSTSSSTVSTPVSQTASESGSTEKPPQVNKGRCYMCRAKIPLAKQAINKCRCEFIFCDAHKATNKHDCDFDFAKMGKDQLAKNNPKLNDKPRGGRSFTRMDS